MSIVKSYSKSNDTYYAYEQNMKWNPVTKRPEGTRKLIGKFDPVTGEIIPTGKRGRKKKEDSDSPSPEPGESRLMKQNQRYQEEARQLREQLSQLYEENSKLKKQISSYEKTLDQIAGLAGKKI
jgi:predicted RNase H-like nuclease (RuvC/YqgF family)